MAYEWQIRPNDKEPTQEEIIQGFIHYVSTLLNLYGAGKHLVSYIREFESTPLTKEAVYQIMNFNCDQIEKIKFMLNRCPTITVQRIDDENLDKDTDD